MDVLVTGAAGYIGSATVRELLRRGVRVVACARDLQKASGHLPSGTEIRIADYDDFDSLTTAFRGVETLLLIPSDGFAQSVLRHLKNAIRAAKQSAVPRVVLLSIADVGGDSPFYYAPLYREAEAMLSTSGLSGTVLRSGLYSDFIWDAWIRPSLAPGQMKLPAGESRVAPISRDDVALAAASAVIAGAGREVWTLTGSESLAFQDIASTVSLVTGGAFRYEPIEPADYLLRLWEDSVDPWPHAFSTLLASIVQGRFGQVSEDFERLTGQPSETFNQFLRRVS